MLEEPAKTGKNASQISASICGLCRRRFFEQFETGARPNSSTGACGSIVAKGAESDRARAYASLVGPGRRTAP